MDKRKTLIIGGIVTCLLLLGVIVISGNAPKPIGDTKGSDANRPAVCSKFISNVNTALITTTITSQVTDEYLKDSSHFSVTDVNHVETCWYIVTIQLDTGADPSKVILQQSPDSGSLTLIAGPGTAFSSSELDQKNVPNTVRSKVAVYEG